MWIKRTLLVLCLTLVSSLAVEAAMYNWTDPSGGYNATDRVDKLPPHYRAILRHDVDFYVTPEGYGFERDHNGNVRFFDHTSPAKRKSSSNGPKKTRPSKNLMEVSTGNRVTPEQLAEVKHRYLAMTSDDRPDTMSGKVQRIISGDTFELTNGQKVTYIGIEFPQELKGDNELHKEVMQYQHKIMQGQDVKIVFDEQRFDEKGRMLGFVFVGTDLFVNAELVMNGYARVNTQPPNTEYRKLFVRLENFAKQARLGMWNMGELTPR